MADRKVYTEEFKREAVRLAKERGNIAQTARDLGISDNTLQGWKGQMDKTPDNPATGVAVWLLRLVQTTTKSTRTG